VTAGGSARPFGLGELGRFLEIQNLGLNLPFAVAFLLVASRGRPSLVTVGLVVVAFVAARNVGHSFNRWLDRDLDAANPRTRDRAIPSGRLAPGWALAIAAGSAAVVLVAAFFLNPLALLLAPVALAVVVGYSYSKRRTSLTTAYLGFVEAIVPGAVYVAVVGAVPLAAVVAVGAMFAWGTAFETIHSLGDLASDRALGLRSVPLRLGVARSVGLVGLLHAVAFGLLAGYGVLARLGAPFFLGLGAMAAIAVLTDLDLRRRPTEARVPFQRHFLLSAVFLAGVAVALYAPGLP
jgi:4-hydroxybenzoate polyprenyltransferase